VAKNPAVFDLDKLNWINGYYIRQSPPEKITAMAIPFLIEAGYIQGEISPEKTPEQYKQLTLIVKSVQEHLAYVAQITEHVGIFYDDQIKFESEEARDILRGEQIPQVLEAFRNKLAEMPVVDEDGVKALLKSLTKELKLGGKLVYMPIRVALTGRTHGPELYHIIPILGVERCGQRITNTMAAV
jgi:nondiscriminating glutamyl-tRNA synthetase